MKTKIVTTDIYLASALLALGARIESNDRSDPRHIKFTIIPNEPSVEFQSENLMGAVTTQISSGKLPIDLEYYEKEWVNGTLMINAIAFKNAIQQMKSVVHSS